ncbi:monocarboxylate transporter 7-like [Oppia nitens]|uniref:monocarboxylate transporter 7-like n=1 Tax=Oppia nitens TaxID=1686743 RepID=UPI0023DC84C2|nr:monocarboxylate transporter 7-like [Oppia nitens]
MNQLDSEQRGSSSTKPLVTHVTPDHGWAWVISIACAVINGITFGLVRSYGVLFFQLRSTYQLSRESAIWPFCLCTSFTYLSGPVAGILLNRYTMRTIVFIGGFIAGVGISLCYFSTTILEITLLIGIVQGFGIGLSFMQTPVILAQYFQKYRATATAISYAGGTIGSFIFPPVLDYLLDQYGLNGAFLLIGGILLNSLPFALLLRPPTPNETKVNKLWKGVHKQLSTALGDQQKGNKLISNQQEMIALKTTQKSLNKSLLSRYTTVCQKTIHTTDDINDAPMKTIAATLINNCEDLEEDIYTINHLTAILSDPQNCVCVEKDIYFYNECIDTLVTEKGVQTDNQLTEWQKFWQNFVAVISNPLYLILTITHVAFQWCWMTHQMVIIDFAIDREMSSFKAVVLLSSFAIADLFGRLASGLIADRRLVRKRNIVSVCILLIGALIFMTPVAHNFAVLLSMTTFLGFVCGSIIVLFSVLTMEYVGLQHLPIALGISSLIVGLTTLTRPLIVGYFRDTYNSYDGLFHCVGTLALLAALLWLSEPFARLWVDRQSKYGTGFKISVI